MNLEGKTTRHSVVVQIGWILEDLLDKCEGVEELGIGNVFYKRHKEGINGKVKVEVRGYDEARSLLKCVGNYKGLCQVFFIRCEKKDISKIISYIGSYDN